MPPDNNFQYLEYRKVWLLIGLILIYMVIFLTLTPNPPGLGLMGEIRYGDKIGHFLAYALLIFWFCQLYFSHRHRLFLAGTFILMGITLEYLQGLGGIRMYEVTDMIANSTGVLIGALMIYFGSDRFLYFLEQKVGVVRSAE